MRRDRSVEKKPNANKRIRRIAANVITVCLIGICVVSGWKAFSIFKEYRDDRESYRQVSEKAQPDGYTGDIDFDALRAVNPDIVGWLHYEAAGIDYPVVQGTDNDKYLNTMFDGTYGVCGTLFVDSVTENAFTQFNTIIYGHHMRDGSMFGSLKELKDKEFCMANPRLELITPSEKYHLEIWAFLNQPSDSRVYTTNIEDLTERQEYIDMVRSTAEYTVEEQDVNVGPNDTLVVLSTCAYEYQNARYIVVCRAVPWE